MSTEANHPKTEPGDEMIEAALHRHFAAELDGQVGRAMARFQDELAAEPVDRGGRGRPGLRRPGTAFWGWAAGVGALAASVALVCTLVNFDSGSPGQRANHPVASHVPRDITATTNASPAIATTEPSSAPERPVERTVWWRTIDEGTVFIDDTPMRRLLRQQVEALKYRDRDGSESVEVTVPRQEIMLVSYNKN